MRRPGLLAAIVLASRMADASDCNCPESFDLDRAVAAADAVFVGHVVALTPVMDDGQGHAGTVATLEVVATWKGADGGRTTVYSNVVDDCGIGFSSDASYVVFGRGSSEAGRELETDRCSGTRRIGEAMEALSELGPPLQGELPEGLRSRTREAPPCGTPVPGLVRDVREVVATLGLGAPRDGPAEMTVCGADGRLHRYDVRVSSTKDPSGARVTTAVFRELPVSVP